MFKFRLLADQLDEYELQAFILKLIIQHIDRNCMLNFLFEYFQKNDIDTKIITNYVSTIIKSRKTQQPTTKTLVIVNYQQILLEIFHHF